MAKRLTPYVLAALSLVLLPAAETAQAAGAGAGGRAAGAAVGRAAGKGTRGAKTSRTSSGRPMKSNILRRTANRSNAVLYARSRRSQMLQEHIETNGYIYRDIYYEFRRAVRGEQIRERREAILKQREYSAEKQFQWLLIAAFKPQQSVTAPGWSVAASYQPQPFACAPSSNSEPWQGYAKRCQSPDGKHSYLAIVHKGCYAPARETVGEFSRRCVLTSQPE